MPRDEDRLPRAVHGAHGGRELPTPSRRSCSGRNYATTTNDESRAFEGEHGLFTAAADLILRW